MEDNLKVLKLDNEQYIIQYEDCKPLYFKDKPVYMNLGAKYLGKKIGMRSDKYKRIMNKNFNAYNIYYSLFPERNDVYFKTQQDAQLALDWINSVLIINKISK